MRFSLIPSYSFHKITDVSIDFIENLGIKFLMLDLDNTIAAYDESSPADDVSRWAADLRGVGVQLYIVSNSARKRRVWSFAKAMGIGKIMNARKPSPARLLKVMAASGFTARESGLIGDQIFTDTLAANRAGIVSIIVRPRRFSNPLLALRFAFEAPFRAACRNKMWKDGSRAGDQ